MKTLLVLSLMLAAQLVGPRFAFAENVWLSSRTATTDTLGNICGRNQRGRTLLHAVCVNDAPSGTITLYNSQVSAANTFAVIRATSAVNAGCIEYDVLLSSGLAYTTSATMDVTFLHRCGF